MVSYQDADQKPHDATGERHIIDMKMYNEIHGHALWKDSNVDLDPELLSSDDLPDNTFVYLASFLLKGFNLRTKKWVDLFVDRFSEVEWNTGAF